MNKLLNLSSGETELKVMSNFAETVKQIDNLKPIKQTLMTSEKNNYTTLPIMLKVYPQGKLT